MKHNAQYDENVNFFIKTKESHVCKDADLLELAFQAKIFIEQGFKAKEDWLHNIDALLRSESAKMIFKTLLTVSSTDWWSGLKKLEKMELN